MLARLVRAARRRTLCERGRRMQASDTIKRRFMSAMLSCAICGGMIFALARAAAGGVGRWRAGACRSNTTGQRRSMSSRFRTRRAVQRFISVVVLQQAFMSHTCIPLRRRNEFPDVDIAMRCCRMWAGDPWQRTLLDYRGLTAQRALAPAARATYRERGMGSSPRGPGRRCRGTPSSGRLGRSRPHAEVCGSGAVT